MSVRFIKQLHQDSLEKAWNARPAKAKADPMLKRRRNVMERLDTALAQLKTGEPNPLHGSYRTRDNCDGVRVQIRCGRRALMIDGRDHWFVRDAETFFNQAREAVERGELDAAINDAHDGTAKPSSKRQPATRKAEPRAAEKSDSRPVAQDQEDKAETPKAAKRGRYAERYEKFLAAGTLREPAL